MTTQREATWSILLQMRPNRTKMGTFIKIFLFTSGLDQQRKPETVCKGLNPALSSELTALHFFATSFGAPCWFNGGSSAHLYIESAVKHPPSLVCQSDLCDDLSIFSFFGQSSSTACGCCTKSFIHVTFLSLRWVSAV